MENPNIKKGTSTDIERIRRLKDCLNTECKSDLVQPLEWTEAGSDHWRVCLECPNCRKAETNIFTQKTVEIYDEDLDRGTQQMISALSSLAKEVMEHETKLFVEALQKEYILPEDF
ncbi:MAG: hypothetical protein QFB86_03340 [Patescibacteria group bacterium]|nr:hypothetical protein [Patescibacteria group bacterium]